MRKIFLYSLLITGCIPLHAGITAPDSLPILSAAPLMVVSEPSFVQQEKEVIEWENAGDFKKAAAGNSAIAKLLWQKGNRYKAISYYKIAFNQYEKTGDKAGMADVLDAMGNVYVTDLQYEKANEYYTQSLALRKVIGDNKELAVSWQQLAAVKYKQEKWQQALVDLSKALTVLQKTMDSNLLATVQVAMGENFAALRQYDSALFCLQQGMQYLERKNNGGELASAYLKAGAIFQSTGELIKAEGYYTKALELAKVNCNKEEEAASYRSFAALYAALKNYNKAYSCQQLYKTLIDSLHVADKTNLLQVAEGNFETTLKERADKDLQIKNLKRNFMAAGIALFLVAAVVIVYSNYKRFRFQHEAKLQAAIIKQQDISTKAVIEAEENERKRIASDLHDGVGQMMSAVKMNLSGLGDRIQFNNAGEQELFGKTLALVDESCKEVRSVSHNMMPNALLKSGLASAVKEFVDKIDSNIIKVNLHAEGLNDRLDANIETVLYRVIQEAVNNVIKHSQASYLDIALIRDEYGISATVEDNGKGFDTSQVEKFKGIGLKNIIKRIEYLKGNVEFDSSIGKGTLIAVHVPVTAR